MMTLSNRAAFFFGALFLVHGLFAQTYWGMTSSGGASDIGTLFTITETSTFTKRFEFTQVSGATSKCDLIKATNGKYYGVTELGGAGGFGTVFSYDPATSTYTTLASFNSTNGEQPTRGLVQSTVSGRLYGTCSAGGANGFGTIFDFNITTGLISKRHDFVNAGANLNGRAPRGGLVEASNGRLYGTTQIGGATNQGTIFELLVNAGGTTTFTKKIDLTLAGGARPYAGLFRASSNLLYGTTTQGGSNSDGVIFSYNVGTNAYTDLVDLVNATGSAPYSELAQNGAGGLLYGTTSAGGATDQGVIFSYNIATDTYTAVVDLNPAIGYRPLGRLRRASNGLFYGLTNFGGLTSAGVLFSFNPVGNVYTPLFNMYEGNLRDAWAGLIEDPNGTFLGVCNDDGSGGSGALFRYVPATNTMTELTAFGSSNGSQPKGRLVRHTTGLFYGLTNSGGSNNVGTCFSFDPVSSAHERLSNMGGTLGDFPVGTLVLKGTKYYGLCSAGGANGGGTLFSFDPSNNTFAKLKDLDAVSGTAPRTGLFLAANGTLYGTTGLGGANGLGTLFSYDTGSNTLAPLVALSNSTGSAPNADLMQVGTGLLYGVLSENGDFGDGVLFSFDTGTNTFLKLYNFDGTQGGGPSGKPVLAADGKLYGTCREGGGFLNGCIYSWDITNAVYTQLYDMQTTDGALSESNLVQGTDLRLYGVCTQGGSSSLGTIFRYNPSTNSVGVITNFAGATNGSLPFDGLVPESAPTPPTNVSLALRVLLEGPYNSGTGVMNDALRSLASFPLTEPFTSLGFTHVGGGGGETIAPSVLTTTGNNAITDWIFVELRSKTSNTTVLRTQSALVQRDGDVVALDGVSALTIPVVPDEYYIAVRHRNHLATMTLATVVLSATPPLAVDLTNGTVATFGTNAQKINGSTRLLWAGNVIRDTQLKYAGGSNDRDPILVKIGGVVPTATTTGYWPEDVTLDGVVKYAGGSNDRDPILVNIGGSIPTAVRAQQLP
ncbi:MAG: hypothetical protein IPI41_11015 [Flavobacteriales bacterium]|nr:hypothetical protein [Flavobacteriales bacterium]